MWHRPRVLGCRSGYSIPNSGRSFITRDARNVSFRLADSLHTGARLRRRDRILEAVEHGETSSLLRQPRVSSSGRNPLQNTELAVKIATTLHGPAWANENANGDTSAQMTSLAKYCQRSTTSRWKLDETRAYEAAAPNNNTPTVHLPELSKTLGRGTPVSKPKMEMF
ncbi:hypothetical protein CHU98_g9817 [Xylaria longipes]|nr:hypothetical protein CHU98_g9817 [Xylaria longipes]